MKRLLLLAALFLPLSFAGAQETNESRRLPQELAITRSVVVQDADEFQSTAGFRYFRFPDEKHTTAEAEFEYGLTDRWELDAEVPYEFVKPNRERSVDGIGDVETAVRYAVVPVDRQPVAITAGLGVGIPTGDRVRDLGEGRLTMEPFFTASTWLGRFNAQLNCGWQRAVTDAGEEPRDEFTYNVAIMYPVDRWFLALEGDGTSTRETTAYTITPEVVCRLAKNMEFLVGVPVGVTGDGADYGVVVEVTLELDNATHRGTDKD